MLVDLSHVSDAATNDVLDAAEAPPIFSHSGVRAVCDHVRNVPDAVLERLRTTDGVVMVPFVPAFVSDAVRLHREESDRITQELARWQQENPAPRATLPEVADHVDHVRDAAGIDHVGLGSDFDGIQAVPVGLEDVSRYPALLLELRSRGYSIDDLKKVAGENLLRVFKEVERVAARLRVERPAADVLFEETSGR